MSKPAGGKYDAVLSGDCENRLTCIQSHANTPPHKVTSVAFIRQGVVGCAKMTKRQFTGGRVQRM